MLGVVLDRNSEILLGIVRLFIDEYRTRADYDESAYVGCQIDVDEGFCAVRWFELIDGRAKSLRNIGNSLLLSRMVLELWGDSGKDWGTLFLLISPGSGRFKASFKSFDDAYNFRVTGTHLEVAVKEVLGMFPPLDSE